MILDGMQGRTEESTLTYVFGRTDAALPLRATADAGRVMVCGFVAAPGRLPNTRAGRQLLYANGHVVLAPQVGWHGEAGTRLMQPVAGHKHHNDLNSQAQIHSLLGHPYPSWWNLAEAL